MKYISEVKRQGSQLAEDPLSYQMKFDGLRELIAFGRL